MADQEFRIRIISEADNSGVKSATAAHEDLKGETGRLTDATKESAKSAEHDVLARQEQKRILLDIGNVVAPGAGQALMELAIGPVGVALALVGAYEMLKKTLEDNEAELDKVAEAAAKPQTGGIEAIRAAWENAAKATGAYYAAMQTAGQDNDPVATEIKRAKELADAQTATSKSIISDLGQQTIARLRDLGATEAQIDAAKRQTQAQLDALDKAHEHAVGSDALKKEQAERLAQNDKLQREANQAIADQHKAEAEYNKKYGPGGTLPKVQDQLDPSTEAGKTLKKRLDEANSKLMSAQNMPDVVSGMGVGPDIDNRETKRLAIEEAQSELEKAQAEATALRKEYDQLKRDFPMAESAKAAADKRAANATSASENNQARLRQLPDEIGQAQTVESTKDHAQSVIDVLHSTSRQFNTTFGQFASAVGLTEQQKLNIVERILNHAMTMQQAWNGMEARLRVLESQGRHVATNTR
jgi:hypothetical protein